MKVRLFAAAVLLLLAPAGFATDFGSGADGARTVSAFENLDAASGFLTGSSTVAGVSTTVNVERTHSRLFAAGDEVLFLDLSDSSGHGRFEFGNVLSVAAVDSVTQELTLENPISAAYVHNGAGGNVLVQEVKHHTALTVTASGQLENGESGVVAIRATSGVVIEGSISATGRGLAGGGTVNADDGREPFGSGGGGEAGQDETIPSGGGGAGFATGGSNGGNTTSGGNPIDGGVGGSVYGTVDFSGGVFYGAGGGSGGAGLVGSNGAGGRGGGFVYISAPAITFTTGTVSSNGGSGENGSASVVSTKAGGGGGAGGSVWLRAADFFGTGQVLAVGGNGGAAGVGNVTTGTGGSGGDGRVRIDGTLPIGITVSAGSTHFGAAPTVTPETSATSWDFYQ